MQSETPHKPLQNILFGLCWVSVQSCEPTLLWKYDWFEVQTICVPNPNACLCKLHILKHK